jgi:hypothetical protein
MKTLHTSHGYSAETPLDVVERVVSARNWSFDRRGEMEMAVQVPGHWCDYSLYFSWNGDVNAMHFSCAFDMRVPEEKRRPVNDLVMLINEKLWMGHFGMWEGDGLPIFQHALPLRGTDGPTKEQMEDILEAAVLECERFYPAFQFVIWGGRSAQDAVTMAMIDTVGEA